MPTPEEKIAMLSAADQRIHRYRMESHRARKRHIDALTSELNEDIAIHVTWLDRRINEVLGKDCP